MEYKNGSALSGIRVLDLGNVLSAPLGAAILADLGAEVIKVERPKGGDSARFNNPIKDGVSTYFINFNRSKKGITLDMKAEEGKEILRRLIKSADVLIENFRPGVMDRLGFGYEDVSKLNPRLIYASVSGFGQSGPYSQRAGYDPVAQAMSGIMSVTGDSPEKVFRCGASIADVMAGQNLALAILAALQYRERTGRGQQIDVALTDVCIIGMSSVNLNYLTFGTIPQPLGNGYVASAPGDVYPTADGRFVTLAGNQKQWEAMCGVLGHPEWADMPEFKSNIERVNNKPILNPLIASETIKYTTEDIVGRLIQAGLPAGPIMNVGQVVNDEHFGKAREMFTEVEDERLGTVKIMNQSFKMSETNPYVRGSAPQLGEHNAEILQGLGYSEEEIAALKNSAVI